ncbi:MAG: hypothetical protein Q8926_04370 [Bacteroidota bacterium]|nr:hypothetical protein [Bacteroidota bacterium]
MKKLFLLAGFFCLHSFTHAQSAASQKIIFSGSSIASADHLVKAQLLPVKASVNARALRDFRDSYPDVQDETWTALPNNETSCMFRQSGTETRIYYSKHGYRRFTILRYGADHLGNEISEQVNNYYKGYHVSNVNEINIAGLPTTYLMNLEVLDHIKVVRFTGDNIEAQQEIEKP